MVIVLMGERTAVAATLATELGWPLVPAERQSPDHLLTMLRRAADRRQHTVVTAAPLDAAARQAITDAVHPVRFVALAPLADADALVVREAERPLQAATLDAEETIRSIRHHFGV